MFPKYRECWSHASFEWGITDPRITRSHNYYMPNLVAVGQTVSAYVWNKKLSCR